MQTIERQRAIKRILSDGVRSKVRAKVEHVYSYHVRWHVDADTHLLTAVLISTLKNHLRMVCIWLEWIENGGPSLQHAINRTRHVSNTKLSSL